MAVSNQDVRSAKKMLEKAGIRKSVSAPTLVAASRQIKRPLRETLDLVMQGLAAAEGLT